jgi:hypothetical protein
MAKSTDQENGRKSGIIRVAQAVAIILGAVGTAVAAVYGATKPTGIEAEAVYHAQSKEIVALQEYAKSSSIVIQKAREECLQQSSRAEAEVAAVKTYVAGYLLGLQAGTTRIQGEKREQKALDALIDAMVVKKRREGKEKVLPAPVPPDVSKLKRPSDYQSVIQQSKN